MKKLQRRFTKRIGLFGAAALAISSLAACQSEAVTDDPLRTEFVQACEKRREYQPMAPYKRSVYCACGYDKTMAGLSDEEKQFARFYLLTQVGVDVRSRRLIVKPDMKAMMKASNAIGMAAKRCS